LVFPPCVFFSGFSGHASFCPRGMEHGPPPQGSRFFSFLVPSQIRRAISQPGTCPLTDSFFSRTGPKCHSLVACFPLRAVSFACERCPIGGVFRHLRFLLFLSFAACCDPIWMEEISTSSFFFPLSVWDDPRSLTDTFPMSRPSPFAGFLQPQFQRARHTPQALNYDS